MIRGSTVIAMAALLLSLLLHFGGLHAVQTRPSPQPSEQGGEDAIAVGNAFEDFTEPQPEPPPAETTPPPEPEPADVPKPEPADVPEPESAKPPISEALVASETPQSSFAPDTGTAEEVTSQASGAGEQAPDQIAEPQTRAPSGTQQDSLAAPQQTAPTVPDPTPAPPVAAAPPVPPEPQPRAALSVSVPPSLPVTPSPVPSTVPTIPLGEASAPETLEPLSDPEAEGIPPERADTAQGETDQAVAVSLRPKLSRRRSQGALTGEREAATDLSALRSPPLIESPLSAYQNGETNPFAGQSGGSLAEGFGLQSSRNTGNASTTNYAGRVLLHLNRAVSVRVSVPGVVQVLFEINPDGSLAGVEIISNTGTQELARAAKRQVQNADPFPPPPKGVKRRMSFVYRSN
ncbi:cell envelope integrity protein TolA [Pseudophaeobacter sp.]|uniref:cell envelope integrity protein TolA n=1 Tax=Pseudophaeobacter sp. TaxID=1971739 RepID=UPI00326440B3